MAPRLPLPLLAVGAAALLAGCGSSASGATKQASTAGNSPSAYATPAATATAAAAAAHVQTLKLTADPNGALRFNTTHLTAKAGKVKIVMTNPSTSGMPHGIAIQDHGSSPIVAAGKSTSVTATLKKGRYTFLCPVPGHAAAGMKGTLTIR